MALSSTSHCISMAENFIRKDPTVVCIAWSAEFRTTFLSADWPCLATVNKPGDTNIAVQSCVGQSWNLGLCRLDINPMLVVVLVVVQFEKCFRRHADKIHSQNGRSLLTSITDKKKMLQSTSNAVNFQEICSTGEGE